MARQSNERERDEYGRFMSDEDDGRSRGRGSSYRERDEQGRFMSDDDNERRGYRSRSSSRYEDEDDYRRSSRGGRGHGGWFGDPEGHSEASERGWEGRSSSRGGRYSSRYEDDDNERSSRGRGRSMSRYEDEDDRRSSRGGRGQGGWFGDPEGHSEASRRGWRTSEHEGSGWYGDPEGHSEASQRGWEGRGSSRGSRSSSRYEDEDDDRRSSRSRGGRSHGGWFGDSRGHSEAARRGWEDRD